MTTIRIRFLVALLLLLTLTVGVTHAQDNTLRVLSNADIRTSDPHVAYETETWPTAALFYIGLVRWNAERTEIVPALAESYSISDDGLVYSFTLREGLLFSDGSPLTTAEVKWSFERMFNPDTLSPTAYMFEAIAGVPEFTSGEATEVSGIQVIDDLNIEFHLATPVWSLIQRFALPPGFIVNPAGVEAAENFGHAPAGAGPFMLDSWEPGLAIRGSRNPNYYLEGQPYFDGLELQMLVEPSVGILRIEAGEADIALDFVPSADYPRLVTDANLSDQLLPTAGFPNIGYVIFNTTDEPFTDVNVRLALAMAVDRERIMQILNNRGEAAAGPIPPNVLGNNPDLEVLAYDPEGAQALLAEAGYPDGFATRMLTNTDPVDIALAQAVINDWSQIGVTVELTSVDNAQYLDTLINQPDSMATAMTNWYLDYPDPSNVYEPLWMCGGSYNWSQYCNEELDAQFMAANSIPPGDERWAAFAAFEAAIVEAMPSVFLKHLPDFYFRSERLQITSDPAVLLRWDEARAA